MEFFTAYVDEPGAHGLTLASEATTLQGVLADLCFQAGFELFHYYCVEEGVYEVWNVENEQEYFKAIVEGV